MFTFNRVKKQLSVVKLEESVTLSENDKIRMMEEAQHIVLEMRRTGCTVQRDKARNEQEEAHKRETLLIHLLIALWQLMYSSWMK